MNVSKIQSHRKEPWGQQDRCVRAWQDPHPPQVSRPQCVLLTTPMEVSAVARLIMVGIRLNLPAWGEEAALDRHGWAPVGDMELEQLSSRPSRPASLPVHAR